MTSIKYIVEQNGHNLGNFLQQQGFSSSLWHKMMNQNLMVYVNHHRRFRNYKLEIGDEIVFNLPRMKASPNIKESDGPIEIVYEDEFFLFINKPANLLTIPSPSENESVAARIKGYQRQTHQMFAIHPLGRLDAGTSGIVGFAKDPLTHAAVQSRKLIKHKVYKAVISNYYNLNGSLWLSLPISHDYETRRQVVRIGGKKSLSIVSPTNHNRIVQVEIMTGRMHQIRCHLASIGRPIVGDKLYGGDIKKHTHQLLHCEKIELQHPFKNEKLTVFCEMPKYFLRY